MGGALLRFVSARAIKFGGAFLALALLAGIPMQQQPAGAASSGQLTFAQIEGYWIKAGGSPADAPKAAAITGREAGFYPGAIQPGVHYCGSGGDRTGWGLWQITCGDAVPAFCEDYALLDPWNNAEAAVKKFNDAAKAGDGWSPWAGGAPLNIPNPAPAPVMPTSDPGQFVPLGSAPLGTHNASAPGTPCGPSMTAPRSSVAASANGTVVYSVDTSGHIVRATYNGTWHVGTIGSPAVRADSSIATNPSGSAVYFVGTNNALQSGFYSNGWKFGSIGLNVAAGSGLAVSADNHHVFYVDTNNQIAETIYTPGRWTPVDIGGAPRPGSTLAIKSDASAVYFVNRANQLSSLSHNTTWHLVTLKDAIVSIFSPITATPTSNNVFYADTNGHLIDTYYSGGAWHNFTIPNTNLRGGSVLATNGTNHSVYYVGSNGVLVNAYYSATAWHTGGMGGTVRANSGLAASTTGTVFTVNNANELQNTYNSKGWHTAPIHGATLR